MAVELHHQLAAVAMTKLDRHVPRRDAALQQHRRRGVTQLVVVHPRTAAEPPEQRPVPVMGGLGPHAVARTAEQQPQPVPGNFGERILDYGRDDDRSDFSRADRAHPEVELVYVGGPSPGTFRGLAGMAEGHGGWWNAWDDFRVAADEYRELDEERVLVLDQPRGRGKSSGLDVGQKGATLFHIRDGRVIKFMIAWDRDRALADLGLTPDTGT